MALDCPWQIIIVFSGALVLGNSADLLKGGAIDRTGVNEAVKSALGNGTVSEVVVKKDLLLYPLNAPNLVLSHRQEFHAVPTTSNASTGANNGQSPSSRNNSIAELAEVNEYTLSQVVVTNETRPNDQIIVSNSSDLSKLPPALIPVVGNVSSGSSARSPGKLLEIVSGFNPVDGLVTEKVALPASVTERSRIQKRSIIDNLFLESLISATDLATTTSGYSDQVNSPYLSANDRDNVRRQDRDLKVQESRSNSGFQVKSLFVMRRKRSNNGIDKTGPSDDLEAAEDIVFRPLFRYRQETRLRPKRPIYAKPNRVDYEASDEDQQQGTDYY